MKISEKSTLDWLWNAIKHDSKVQNISILDNCAVATDGIRLHAINGNLLPSSVDDLPIADVLDLANEGDIISQFSINPKFLIDALAGFSDRVDIALINNEDKIGITITSDDSENMALVMCIVGQHYDLY